jgi:sugar O-acyltransferase (sialic acid O-acetyltransferase NeuD family)
MKLLIAGAGGHGRVVADAALMSGQFSHVAFIDDAFPNLKVREEWPLIGTLESMPSLVSEFDGFFSAFGSSAFRLDVLAQAIELGFTCPTIIHPSATVSKYAKITYGCVLCAGSIVNVGAELGHGCIINTGATVDHDCKIDAGVHICPGAHLAGGVKIGEHSWFGVGAIAKQGIVIGAKAMIGAGAVVVSDVPAGKTFVGVPARELSR